MIPRSPRLVQDSLKLSAARFGDKAAIIEGSERVTYSQLSDRAMRLATQLQEGGVRRGDRVAIFLENSVDTIVGIYGALHAGAAFLVINPQTKADKLQYVLEDSGTVAVVSAGRLADTVVGLMSEPSTALQSLRLLVTSEAPAEPMVPGASHAFEVVSLEGPPSAAVGPAGTIPLDLAALVYTSGSTGNPKGVMLSHQNMVFTLGSLVEYLRLDESDVIINFLPLAFDYGLYQALMSIYLGATLVLERTFAFPSAIVQRVNDEGVTVFPGVPTVFATLLSIHRNSPLSMPSIRRFTNTAAHLPDEFVPGLLEVSPKALIYKMYGLTECKRVSYLEPELVSRKPSSVGKAIPGTEVRVLDDNGEEVAPGETGILYVRGPHVMMGYWNLPEETAHMLKPGLYPGERVLCTHDQFRVDDEGFLYFMGRSDDIIKSRGEKVSPVEVENALASIRGVREVAVIGVRDAVLGQAIRAYVVLDDGVDLGESSLKREAARLLESFMVPQDVRFVESLPKTATGKVRKKSLVEAS